MCAPGHVDLCILLDLENKQFSTWLRASSIGSVDICDLYLTVLLMCLLRLACINESQFPLLISNVTINLLLSGPDPTTFQLATVQGEVTLIGFTPTTAHTAALSVRQVMIKASTTEHIRFDIKQFVIKKKKRGEKKKKGIKKFTHRIKILGFMWLKVTNSLPSLKFKIC